MKRTIAEKKFKTHRHIKGQFDIVCDHFKLFLHLQLFIKVFTTQSWPLMTLKMKPF